jgi:pyruvate/2-oxoglutarate/acetoin dehydrogenase E1 component
MWAAVSMSLSDFKGAINHAMRMLAVQPSTVFVGQSTRYDGAAIYDSLDGVPMERRIEMPVAEDFQMGFCTGLALAGKLPVCIFPRIDFLVLAFNQLANHLDKLPLFGWNPKVIVRTTVGQKEPLDAGPQHTQNHTDALRLMLTTVQIHEVRTPAEIKSAYELAFVSPESSLIVENPL